MLQLRFSFLSFFADVVLLAFCNLSNDSPNMTVLPAKLQQFLTTYFEEPGTEFEPWTPPDWSDKWDPVDKSCFKLLQGFHQLLPQIKKKLGQYEKRI